MRKLMNSRARIWTHGNLCFFSPTPPLVWICLTAFPLPCWLSMCVSLCSMPLFCSPTCLLVLPLSCPFASWPGSFHCLCGFFFFLFAVWMMEALLANSLILSCDNHHPCLNKSLLHISHLAWHQNWKRLLMTLWTFLVCKLCNGTNDFISV